MLPPPAIQLIVGLGNPGDAYRRTRHNIGFMALDALAERCGLTWYSKSRYQAQIADWNYADRKVWLLKPETFMNLSGESVGKFCRDKALPRQAVLVLHDELDIPLGQLKAAYDRGPAGHNGVRSLIAHLGGQEFYRFRMGIGKPHGRGDGKSFVLDTFSADEKKLVDDLIQTSVEGVLAALQAPWDQVVQKVHSKSP